MVDQDTDKQTIPVSTENEIRFDKALDKLRREISKGNTLEQAGKALTWLDTELKSTVINEFIKIVIAEQHFGNGRGLDDIALFLGVPYEKVENTKKIVEKELSLFQTDIDMPEWNMATH